MIVRIALLIAVAVAPIGGGCITDRVLRETDGHVVVDDDVVARTKRDTAALRGLPFTRDVPLEVMTVAQLEEWLNRYYDQYKVALKKQDYFYHKMGILPASRDSASTWKGFLGGFAGGVYDDDREALDGTKGSMILVQDYAWWSKVQLDMIGLMTGNDLAYEVFLAHELTHALQDQHFQLDRLLEEVPDDDVRMVQKTMLESEGNVIGMAHFVGMHLDDVAERKAFFGFLRYNNLFNAPLMSLIAGKTPSFFARQTFAQYELGLDWVEQRLDDGEWKEVIEGVPGGAMAELARSYARVPGTPGALPASTEQLLFSDKRYDPPLQLPPLVLDEELLPGAVANGGDVFGALALKHWIERPFNSADPIARGWGGDHCDVFVDDDDSPILLWRLLGDSDDDARELLIGLRERLQRSIAAERFVVVEDAPDRVLVSLVPDAESKKGVRITRPERLLLERRGAAVVVVNGVSERVDLPRLTEVLFAQTQAVEPAAVDVARRRSVAAELERTLDKAIADAPKDEGLALGDRLVLPRRTMAVRVGFAGSFFDDPDRDDDEFSFFAPDVEARWGIREHLELALPGALTLRSELGPFLLAVGVAPRSLPFFDPIKGTWSGRILATTTWQTPTIALHVQAETAPAFVVNDLEAATSDQALRVGLSMRPVPWLVVQPAISAENEGNVDDDGAYDTVRFGGVLQRGFLDAPLIELEVIPGLMAYLASSVSCRVEDGTFGGLTIVEQRHALGLLLYF
ncbi:MAG: hypothetical protein Q8O67_25255 [Deltaproteobacteria bacterium]|nr:hypothetical protein [Deltaproteobacteria bacterium]